MTSYAEAERARQRAIKALRAAGLHEQADRLAALPPITDARTAALAVSAYGAADAALDNMEADR